MANDVDDIDPQRYLEYVFPAGVLRTALQEAGFLDVQLVPDRQEPYSYELRMRQNANISRDAVAIRNLLREIVRGIPPSPTLRVRWCLELCVAIVSEADTAAAFTAAYIGPQA